MTQRISKSTRRHRTEEWQPDRLPDSSPLPLSHQSLADSLHAPPPNGAASSSPRAADSHSQRVTILLPTPLIERLRNAIYWTEQRTLTRIITDAIHDAVAEMEQTNGGTFPPRLSPLKRGRPCRGPLPERLPPIEPPL